MPIASIGQQRSTALRAGHSIARGFFGAAEAVWLGSGAIRWRPFVANYERDLADLTSQLDAAQLQHAWRLGSTLTAQEAVDYALRPTPTKPGPART